MSTVIIYFEDMSIIQKILKKIGVNSTCTLSFKVISVEKEILNEYHDLHWYLSVLLDQRKVPMNILYIGTVDKEQKIIETIHVYEGRDRAEEIKEFLRKKGIEVANIKKNQ